MKPLVSVIIPVYNAEKYLKESLESVFSQTFQDFEIIAVDDGSTDKSIDVLNNYNHSIRLITQTNSGPARARNTGIKAAAGKYIALLDADDLWTSDKLRLQINYLEKRPDIGMVFADMLIFEGADVIVPSFLESIADQELYKKILKQKDKIENFGSILLQCNVVPTGTVVIRKSCLKKTGLFDEDIYIVEDLEQWLKISMFTDVAFIPKILKKKREHQTNISNEYFKVNIGIIKIVEKHREIFQDFYNKNRKFYRKLMSETYYDLGYNYFEMLDLEEAKSNFKKSITQYFSLSATIYLLSCYFNPGMIRWIKKLKSKYY
jgi:glycosyltransferase involved in cell wall biosynthesis